MGQVASSAMLSAMAARELAVQFAKLVRLVSTWSRVPTLASQPVQITLPTSTWIAPPAKSAMPFVQPALGLEILSARAVLQESIQWRELRLASPLVVTTLPIITSTDRLASSAMENAQPAVGLRPTTALPASIRR